MRLGCGRLIPCVARANVVGLAGPTVGALSAPLSPPLEQPARPNRQQGCGQRTRRCRGEGGKAYGRCGPLWCKCQCRWGAHRFTHQDGLAGRVALSGIEQLGTSARLDHFTNRNGVRTVNRGREMSNRAG